VGGASASVRCSRRAWDQPPPHVAVVACPVARSFIDFFLCLSYGHFSPVFGGTVILWLSFLPPLVLFKKKYLLFLSFTTVSFTLARFHMIFFL
jgi:hypothetical protein